MAQSSFYFVRTGDFCSQKATVRDHLELFDEQLVQLHDVLVLGLDRLDLPDEVLALALQLRALLRCGACSPESTQIEGDGRWGKSVNSGNRGFGGGVV